MKEGPTILLKIKEWKSHFWEGPTISIKRQLLSTLHPTMFMKVNTVR